MNNDKHEQQLYHSLSQLSPDVFSHPLWIYFSEMDAALSPQTVDEFLQAAEKLRAQGDLSNASQALLMCAALQSRLGDTVAALNSAEQARKLAEQHDLPHLAWCADWGTSCLYVQLGRYREAANHTQRLQAELNEHNRWVLSNIVAVIGQSLSRQAENSAGNGSSFKPPTESALSVALDWLLHWGEPPAVIEKSLRESEGQRPGSEAASRPKPPFPVSIQNWRALWSLAKDLAGFQSRSNGRRPNGTAAPPASRPPARPSEPGPVSTASGRLEQEAPALAIHLLGRFQVYHRQQLVEKWPGNKCKAIFKYLLIHRQRPVHREILMDLFWPEVDPEPARRSLYQAIYMLRQTLQADEPEFPFILCEDSAYRLNPEIDLWLDSHAFDRHYQRGQQLEGQRRLPEAVEEFQAAERLYEGDFLSEDIYEEWTLVHRENLRHAYLDVLDRLSQYYCAQEKFAMCITYCQKILSVDSCREDAHRRLMRAYLGQGKRHLALRQYQRCVEVLAQELDVDPMPATVDLYKQMQGKPIQRTAA